MEIEVIEYRNGYSKEGQVIKIPGQAKVDNVTLRRGVIGSLALWRWIDQLRNGDAGALRNVTIHLQNEDRSAIV
jgi:phage tail-like protein